MMLLPTKYCPNPFAEKRDLTLSTFLDRVATHILAFEGDSHVTWFEGNYEAYHEHRRNLLGDAADRPTRVKFRPVAHK